MKGFFHFLGTCFFPRPTIDFVSPLPGGEPIVFVANHEKNYGPAVMQLYFPIQYRPWIIHPMLEAGACRRYVRETFFEERLKWPAWLSAITSRLIEPLLIQLMRWTNPVPVHRGNPERIVETFRVSLEALRHGDNLLIFPENPQAAAYSANLQEFFSGFLYLAKLYARETGNGLVFCPVSINPVRGTVTAGRPVRFSPHGQYPAEAERVRQHLMSQIAGLYQRPPILPFPQGISGSAEQSVLQP